MPTLEDIAYWLAIVALAGVAVRGAWHMICGKARNWYQFMAEIDRHPEGDPDEPPPAPWQVRSLVKPWTVKLYEWVRRGCRRDRRRPLTEQDLVPRINRQDPLP